MPIVWVGKFMNRTINLQQSVAYLKLFSNTFLAAFSTNWPTKQSILMTFLCI